MKQYENKKMVLMRKYKPIVEAWRDEEDDRRIAYNMYIQLCGVCDAMMDMTNTFVKVFVNGGMESQEKLIDEIITRFTGMTYDKTTCRWDDGKAKTLWYMSLETGELLTPGQMRKVFAEEYDGDDPTNLVHWSEYFEEVRI